MTKLLRLIEKGFADENGESVDLKNLELKMAFTRPSSIGAVREGKIIDQLLDFGNKIGADYALFFSDGYAGGAFTVVDIINSTPHVTVNYYCKRQ